MSSNIIGIGGYLPGKPVSNTELSEYVDTNDEWITTRTGIKQRFFAEEPLADLAYKAAIAAIQDSPITKEKIDLIILSTTTPDKSFPSTATMLQGMLDINDVPSFDMNAVCSGFVYALDVANAYIASGKYKNILVVGADKMSSVLDMEKRSTAVLFGDGAGAVIISKSENAKFHSLIKSNGKLSHILETTKNSENRDIIEMNGTEVFKNAVYKMSDISKEVLKNAEIKIDDIDFFIPHQANIRILNAVAEKINIPLEKVVTTITHHANTSAATIPLALNELKMQKKLTSGNKLLMSALGAGITYGGVIIEVSDEYNN